MIRAHLYILCVAVLAFACKPKDKKEPDPEPTNNSSISVTANYNSKHQPSFATKYYTGDTIRYTVKVTSETGITEFKVIHNNVTDSTRTSFPNNKDYTHSFMYVVEELPGSTCTIYFQTTENGLTKNSSSISFTVSSLHTKTSRCYNKAASLVNDSFHVTMRFPETSASFKEVSLVKNSEIIINDPNNDYALLTSTHADGFIPSDNTKNFFKTFTNNQGNATIVPATVSFDLLLTPNLIISNYNNNLSNKIVPANTLNRVNNVAIGDTYIVKLFSTGMVRANTTYAVVKIKNIVDDNNTSDSGGNELDYLEFEIKYFSANRF